VKRLPVIRHIRWAVLSFMLAHHITRCQRMGIGLFAQPDDEAYLQRVWEGKQ
jgi:hypothetical protein